MKVTETQLKELIKEEMILQEMLPLGMIAKGGMAALRTSGGRKAIAAILRLPDTLLKKVGAFEEDMAAKNDNRPLTPDFMKSQGFGRETMRIMRDVRRHALGASTAAALADFIEGMNDKEMKDVLAAVDAGKTAAPTLPTPGGAPQLSVVGGTDVAVESLTHLTTERFKQIVQEELKHTTQMERKLK
jgi:hypothetical protein